MPHKRSNDNPLVIGDKIAPLDDDYDFGLQQPLSTPARRLRIKMQTKTLQTIIKHNDTIHSIKNK